MIDTKTKILDVAEDLIQRVRLNAMSYKDISDAVGIRKPSIHHHFPKKEDLVNALLVRCIESHKDMYNEIVYASCSPMQKLRGLADIFERGLSLDKVCLIGSINNSCTTLQQATGEQLQHNIENTVALFEIIFAEALQEETLSFTGSAYDAANAYLAFLLGAQSLCRSRGGVEAFRTSVNIFLSALEK